MKFDDIETQADYNRKMVSFETSSAPFDVREKAIRELKAAFPNFDTSEIITPKEVLQMMKDGEADLSDMNGF